MKDLNYYRSLEYSFRVAPDPEGGFLASIPDLPGCYSFGETKEEAITKLDESKNLWLESYYEAHGDAPEPSREQEFSGRFLLRLPKYLHQRLHEDARAEGVSLNQYILSLLAEGSARSEMSRVVATRALASWSLLAGQFRFWSATNRPLEVSKLGLQIKAWGETKHAATCEHFLQFVGNLIVPKWAGKEEEIKPWQR